MSVKDVENMIRSRLKEYGIDAYVWVTKSRFELYINVSIPITRGADADAKVSRVLETFESEHMAIDVLDTAIGSRYLELEIHVDNPRNLDLDQIINIILEKYEKYRAV